MVYYGLITRVIIGVSQQKNGKWEKSMAAKNVTFVLNESNELGNRFLLVNRRLGWLFTESTHPNNFYCVTTSEEDVDSSFSVESFLRVDGTTKKWQEAKRNLIKILIDLGYKSWLVKNKFIQE